MRQSKVVRFTPRRTAAPSAPPTRPRHAARVRVISSRCLLSYSSATVFVLPSSPSGVSTDLLRGVKDLTPDQYRSNPYFNSQRNRRTWLNAADAFGKDSNGTEVLSAAGEREIDQLIGTAKDSAVNQPIIVEGYSSQASAADEMVTSRSRSLIVAHYLEKRFHLSAKNIGVIPLNATAPPSSGKDSWDGACIVLVAHANSPGRAPARP